MSNPTLVYVTCPDNYRLEAISEKIESDHLEITMFSRPEHAHKQAEKKTPAAIVVDFVTDSNRAFDVCETIRQTPSLADVPMLAITDVEDLPSIQEIYQVGINDLIIEPYPNCELQARLNKLISQEQGGSSANADNNTSKRPDTIKKIEKQLDDFDLINKIDRIKSELQGNADEMIDIHEQLRSALEQASEAVAKAEYSLQFTDRVAQQVNEIGKLIYGIHIGIKRDKRPYSDKESETLEKSSSQSVLEKQDQASVDELLKSLDI